MKFYLPKIVGIVLKISLVMFFLGIRSTFLDREYGVINLNKSKSVEIEHYDIEYSITEKISYNIPLFTKRVLSVGEKGIKIVTNNSKQEPIVIKEPKEEIIEIGKANPGMFVGNLTGYGPDCVGCSGIVACRPYQDVRNGNIYFEDIEYGTLRIIAADRSIPCGTIIEISNFKLSEEAIKAIVLDRGGVIKGNLIDLLYNSEKETKIVGYQRNINYKILRWGR